MSITMYYGRAGSGKTCAVYERIRQVITECPGDPIILLVPEPATYRVERGIHASRRLYDGPRCWLWTARLSGVSIDRQCKGSATEYISVGENHVAKPCDETKRE